MMGYATMLLLFYACVVVREALLFPVAILQYVSFIIFWYILFSTSWVELPVVFLN